jgi:pimeloyl-ACP methyl ester carboxylesterase
MKIIKSTYKLPTLNGHTINLDIRYPEGGKDMQIAIFSHGFKGYKDWGFIPYYCSSLAEHSIIAVNFDFSMNGINDPDSGLVDEEIFGHNTISQEISDIDQVMKFVGDLQEIKDKTNGTFILIGHSLGGAISILAANKNNSINKIILLASISNCNRYTKRQSAEWKKLGKLEFEIYETKQKLYLDKSFLDDIEENYPPSRLCDILGELQTPVLIFHGTEDLSVRIIEGEQLQKAAKNAKLISIPNTGHTFGIASKFTETNDKLEQIINESINFIHSTNV